MKKKAVWHGEVLAESDSYIVVEGNHYFPPEDVKTEVFNKSNKHTVCPWKGQAHYYNLSLEGNVEKNIAWYYPDTKKKAKRIEGYIAFVDQVTIEKD